MNPEVVIQATDTAVFAKTGKHLKKVEVLVLQGTWQGRTYEQIAETCQYSLSYIKQVAAPRLWQSLSEVLGEDVSKTNFRFVVERKWEKSLKISQSQQETASVNPNSHQDWGDAPDVTIFYGRSQELAKLKQWIVKYRCRLVAVTGVAGIGKTALSVSCAKEIQQEFEFVIWRDLRNAPTVEELVTDMARSLSSSSSTALPDNLDRQISYLISYLRQHRCLIVLDTAMAIWQSGRFAGYYREGYQSYGKLIKRLAQEPHQSCLLLIAREKPREIALLEGDTLPIRSLTLKGLRSEAEEIFKEKQLSDVDKWEDLIQLYQGNPLALKIVATTIQELFGGRVAAFFRQNTIVFGDLNDILDEQFECLSELEIEILYWLAIASQPLSLSQLREDILSPLTQADLIEALESLLRRSLVERTTGEGETQFSLQQPVVTQYIIDLAIERICEEIQEVAKSKKLEKLELLRSHALMRRNELNEEVRAMQERLIIAPIADKLCRIFRDESLLEEKLTTILSVLQGKTPLAIGYAKENINRLLTTLKSASSVQSLIQTSETL